MPLFPQEARGTKAPIMAPQVDDAQHKTIMTYIEKGKKEGSLVRGGMGDTREELFIEPNIFTGVAEHVTIMKEEIFGLVVIIDTF